MLENWPCEKTDGEDSRMLESRVLYVSDYKETIEYLTRRKKQRQMKNNTASASIPFVTIEMQEKKL